MLGAKAPLTDSTSCGAPASDWKRSKELTTTVYGDRMGQGPCKNIPDTSLGHYWVIIP